MIKKLAEYMEFEKEDAKEFIEGFVGMAMICALMFLGFIGG